MSANNTYCTGSRRQQTLILDALLVPTSGSGHHRVIFLGKCRSVRSNYFTGIRRADIIPRDRPCNVGNGVYSEVSQRLRSRLGGTSSWGSKSTTRWVMGSQNESFMMIAMILLE